jgi:DNA-binding CsgD family transcriptional regulator
MEHNRDREIADLRANGIMNLSEIGKEYVLSRERVRQICNDMGVDSREATALHAANRAAWKMHESDMLRPEVERLYAAGMYYGEICDQLGIPHSRVVDIVSQMDNEFIQLTRQAAMEERNPNAKKRTIRPPNEDDPRTRWTREKIIEALVEYSQHNEGRLPPNLQYQRDAAGNVDLPSSATVRNTVGKWATVRQIINQINKENA